MLSKVQLMPSLINFKSKKILGVPPVNDNPIPIESKKPKQRAVKLDLPSLKMIFDQTINDLRETLTPSTLANLRRYPRALEKEVKKLVGRLKRAMRRPRR